MTFISGYCSIRGNRIVKDGQVIFDSQGSARTDFVNDAYTFLNLAYPKFYKMSPLAQFGILAAEALIGQRDLAQEFGADKVGVILSNATSSLDADMAYSTSMNQVPSPSLFVYTLPNIVAGEICIRYHYKGENAFFIFGQFDAAFLSRYTATSLESNSVQICLAGWVEVLGDEYDIFLYLVEKQKNGLGIVHTAENLNKLYISG